MNQGVPANSGSQPLSWDPRDKAFAHSRLFGAAPLSALPSHGLGRSPVAIKNQGTTLFCTAFGTAAASEYQEDIELSPEFQVAAISRIAGAPILMGADPRDALKALVAYGSLPQHLAPLSLQTHPPEQVADLRNWPQELIDRAKAYGKAAFIPVDGPYDHFDNIRNALFLGQKDKQAVVAFGRWYRGWNNVGADGIIPDDQSVLHGYHCFLFPDWTIIDGVEYLIAQNSYGPGFGKGGLQYFSRKIVNEAWKPDSLWGDGIGLFILRDISPETIAEQKRTLLFILAGALLKLVTALGLKRPTRPPEPQPAPEPTPAPQPITAGRILHQAALSFVGKDASPKDQAPDELGCVDSINEVWRAAFGTPLSATLSTARLYAFLRADSRVSQVTLKDAQAGDIIICPTGLGSNPHMPHGHVGIVGEEGTVMSNDSATGKWMQNYTVLSWTKYFGVKGGYPIYCFRPK